MAAAQERRVPMKKLSPTLTNKDILFNDICDLLHANHLGWTSGLEKTIGKNAIDVLTSCLWYIDPHWKKLNVRYVYYYIMYMCLAIISIYLFFFRLFHARSLHCPDFFQPL